MIREALKRQRASPSSTAAGKRLQRHGKRHGRRFLYPGGRATAFGFHNFQMVFQLVSLLGKKCGVVINKQEAPWEPLERFCRDQGLPILARIPYDPQIAAMASDGRIVSREDPRLREMFSHILHTIGGSFMKRLLILSGKGGTGKTTTAAASSALPGRGLWPTVMWTPPTSTW